VRRLARRVGSSRAERYAFTHLSDEALVALVARGDDDALGELYDRLGALAYGLAVRIVRDRTIAEEVVQDAFLAAWRSATRFVADRGKARAWLLTIVHRRAVDAVRREEHRRAEPLEPSTNAADAGAEQEAWLHLERERVRAAVSQLPDPQREAIELAYFGGFTQSELADTLGEPIGTIKSRTFSGLRRLRELLADEVEEVRWSTT